MKNTETLISIVTSIAAKLEIKIEKTDIDYVRRTQPKNNTREKSIIVRFLTQRMKSDIIAAAKLHKSIMADDIGYNGNTSVIFINEHLSPSNRLLHWEARNYKKENNIKYLWIKDGKLFMRKTEAIKTI